MSTALVLVDHAGDEGSFDFELPASLVAGEPPEARGLARDQVRLLVQAGSTLNHAAFRDLPNFLEAGDLLVINTSKTLPAAVPALDGRLVHLSTRLPGGAWVVELRRPQSAGSLPFLHARPGERLPLPAGGCVQLLAGYPLGVPHPDGVRLWLAALRLPAELSTYLGRHGRPIRYGYASRRWPLEAYQNVYADEPGSAESPSAGRAFTPELLTALVRKGIGVAPLTLHTGVSSLETDEPPYPEWFRVPLSTADQVNAAHTAGRRVVAVGTTVTRALESVTDERGRTHPGQGWTELVITPERGVAAVDGLLTGWHPPRASHLRLLEAIAGRAMLAAGYAAALDEGYRWHEFGDLHLLLPHPTPRP